MKTSALATTALLSFFAPAALANFDIYFSADFLGEGQGIKIFDKEPQENECRKINGAELLTRSSDVSSSTGFRCNSAGACDYNGSPHDVREMEINFGKDGKHITLYRNRDWGLFDTDDNKLGSCVPAELTDDQRVDCSSNNFVIKWFYCKSDSLDHENVWG